MRTTAYPEAVTLVRRLALSTNKNLDEDQAEFFARIIAGFDPEVAAETVRRIGRTDTFFPSEARVRHVAREVDAEFGKRQARALPAPKDLSEVHPDVRAANIRVLREVTNPDFRRSMTRALDEAGEWTSADYDDAVLGYVYDRVVEITGREPFPNPGSGRRKPSKGCDCDGTGWIEHRAADGTEFVSPCDDHLPATARRHRGGHYQLGHWCEECSQLQRTGRLEDA